MIHECAKSGVPDLTRGRKHENTRAMYMYWSLADNDYLFVAFMLHSDLHPPTCLRSSLYTLTKIHMPNQIVGFLCVVPRPWNSAPSLYSQLYFDLNRSTVKCLTAPTSTE
jgi:hypothetical protein